MKAKKVKEQVQLAEAVPIKLDLGAGTRKREGFLGVDAIAFDGVDVVTDLRQPWPWDDHSVDEVNASHFVEHLTGAERIHFFNELYRVMKVGAQAFIVTPDWSNDCAYGDPTHQWPPMSRWYPLYLNKDWRDREAPHVGYTCDFEYVIGGSWEPWLEVKNQEYQMFSTYHYINALRDLHVSLTKK